VTRDEITTEQAAKIGAAIRPTACFLGRLKRRLEHLEFPPTDPLYQIVVKAEDALQHLFIEMHYLSLKTGTGRPPRM
jgi:hypothetical protein